MPTFLSGTNRGWVKKLQPPAGAAGAIVNGVNITGCLLTRAAVAESCNQQFQHTLGNHIYVYSFGDRIGEMGIGGLAFFDCDLGGAHGVGSALAWYRQRRLAGSGEKVSVTLGHQNLEGYLIAFRADTSQPESALLEFFMSFAMIPEG